MKAISGYDTVDIPNGESTITDTGSINIILSTGVNQPVFNSLSTALKCLNFMNSRNQYFIMAGDDITVTNCQTKLLIFENTFINQKCITSCDFTYHGKTIQVIHCKLSNLFNLTDALISVGFKVTSTASWNTNSDLETHLADSDRPRIKVVDWFYFTTQGSLLSDVHQITF